MFIIGRKCFMAFVLFSVVSYTLFLLFGHEKHQEISALRKVPDQATRTPNNTKGYEGSCTKKTYFEDILLVITYHYPFYDTLLLILSNYKEAFPHIVVCGPSSNSSYNVMVVNLGPGWYGYECLGKAIRLHFGFRGYLYVNDDMIVNWWNFVNFDKDKVWLGAPIELKRCHRVGQRPIRKDWYWWSAENGAKRCERAHYEIKFSANQSELWGRKSQGMLSTLLRNGRSQTLCCHGWSDIFYVPGKFGKQFRYLSQIFFRNKVFLEIAVPTILSFLDLRKNWERTYGTYLPDIYGWKGHRGRHPWNVYSVEKTLFVHPVKFKATVAADLNRRNLKQIVVAHGRRFLRC